MALFDITTTTERDPWYGGGNNDNLLNLNQGIAGELEKPWSSYPGDWVANLDPFSKTALNQLYNYSRWDQKALARDMTSQGKRLQGGLDESSDFFSGVTSGEIALNEGPDMAQVAMMADNPYMNGMIDAASRDVTRNLYENQLPGIAAYSAGTGNLGSSRRGAQEAIAERGAADRVGDISSNMRGSAYERALGLEAQRSSQNAQSRLVGGGALANLGQYGMGLQTDANQLNRSRLQDMFNVGRVKQQQSQLEIDAKREQFTENQQLPLEQLRQISNLTLPQEIEFGPVEQTREISPELIYAMMSLGGGGGGTSGGGVGGIGDILGDLIGDISGLPGDIIDAFEGIFDGDDPDPTDDTTTDTDGTTTTTGGNNVISDIIDLGGDGVDPLADPTDVVVPPNTAPPTDAPPATIPTDLVDPADPTTPATTQPVIPATTDTTLDVPDPGPGTPATPGPDQTPPVDPVTPADPSVTFPNPASIIDEIINPDEPVTTPPVVEPPGSDVDPVDETTGSVDGVPWFPPFNPAAGVPTTGTPDPSVGGGGVPTGGGSPTTSPPSSSGGGSPGGGSPGGGAEEEQDTREASWGTEYPNKPEQMAGVAQVELLYSRIQGADTDAATMSDNLTDVYNTAAAAAKASGEAPDMVDKIATEAMWRAAKDMLGDEKFAKIFPDQARVYDEQEAQETALQEARDRLSSGAGTAEDFAGLNSSPLGDELLAMSPEERGMFLTGGQGWGSIVNEHLGEISRPLHGQAWDAFNAVPWPDGGGVDPITGREPITPWWEDDVYTEDRRG